MPAPCGATMIVAMTQTTAAPARRLARPHDGRMVAGVCRALGDYFDVDPVIFRVLLAVLAFFGGAGIIAYGAGWLLIPDADSSTTRLEHWLRGHRGDRRRDALIVVGALIVFAVFTNNFLFSNRFDYALVIVAIVVAAAALVGHVAGPSSPTVRTTEPPMYGPGTWTPSGTSTWTPAASPTWAPAPAVRRSRSWLGPLTLGATMLTAGVFGIVAATGAAHPQPADVLAACVGVVGLGLLVGAMVGRARLLLIPVGLLLVACLAVADALPRNLTWTSGERTWTPVGTAVQRSYVVGAGNAKLDLTRLTPGQKLTISSSTGAGKLLVLVPPGSAVALTAHVGVGQIEALGHDSAGPGVMQQVNVAGSASPPLRLTLDLHVGFGEVVVRDAAA
jgi:phage shock protein PspC (stress-responsive transcriptional regulator)